MNGFSLNIDNSILDKIDSIDKKIDKLSKTSQKSSEQIIRAFKSIGENGLNVFINKIKETENAMRQLGNKKFTSGYFSNLKNDAQIAVDKVNQCVTVMDKINNQGAGNYRNSAITKINEEIEKSVKELSILQTKLNDVLSGKNRKVEFVDTATDQKRAEGLMWYIDALERERTSLQANARLKINLFQRQKLLDNEWYEMERKKIEQEKKSFQVARERSQAYRKAYEEQYKAYEEMFNKIQGKENSRRSSQSIYNEGTMLYDNVFGKGGYKSIENMRNTISQMEEAQKKLNLNTEDGKKKYAELGNLINKANTELNQAIGRQDNLNKKTSSLLNTSQQLQRALALMFSVSQISNYMNKLVQVRKEMELQQKSLQVLLQSKDDADKLWNQTIDLAVRSPFRVKELVTYTRQLAAYRIETDKLHDTTKRLADVSAGLGVDMQRLILAFGQVRAANFLRGTELRQFTEAGIPMLDELAKYFTELEGKMVSAGDVFERISKRMVSFSDVEEVFRRMTDAGGTFYNMQEEQSKTLAGMISNLHDSIDLMLNDIGKANDGILKGGISAAKEFVENWREVAFYIEKVVYSLAAWKIANAAFVIGMKNARKTTLWLNKALKVNIGTLMSNIQGLKWSEAALVGVTKKQWLLGKATMYVQGALRGAGMAVKSFLPTALIAGALIGLTELYRHLTKTSREAKRLQKELEEIYEEDTSNLRKQVDTFETLVGKLKKVAEGSKEHKNIISQLNSQYGEYLGFLVTEKTTYDELANSINGVTTALTQKAKANTFEKSFNRIIEGSIDEMRRLENDMMSGFLNIGLVKAEGGKILPTQTEVNDIFNLIRKKVLETSNELSSSTLNEILDSYFGEDVLNPSSINFSAFIDYSKEILTIKREEDELQQNLDNLYGKGIYSTKEMRKEMEQLNLEKEKALENDKTRIGREKIEYDYLVKKTKLEGKYQGLSESAIEQNVSKIKTTSATIQDINRQLIESIDELGQKAVDRVYITAQDASQGVNAIAENMAAAYKQTQQVIEHENALKEAGTVHDEQAVDDAKEMAKAYLKVLTIMGRLDLLEDKSDKREKHINVLNKRINLVKELYQGYKKLTEHASADEAKKEIMSAYKDTFKQAFEGTGVRLSGLVIDKEKLKEEGRKSGQIFSEEMLAKMNAVVDKGTYIRNVSDKVKEQIKKDEGFVGYIYDDAEKTNVKTQIKTIEELYKYFDKVTGKAKKVQGQGTLTIGYGHALHTLDEAKKYLGITLQQADAEELLNKDIKNRIQPLNNLLDKYHELIVTQEQYDVLFNNFYQGGLGQALQFAFSENTDKLEAHIKKLDADLVSWGSSFAEEWGDNWLSEFKQLKTGAEKLAKVLEIVSVTTIAKGGHIDKTLFYGENAMKARSARRAAEFRGDLEIVKLLQKSAIDISRIDFTNIKGVIEILKQLVPIAKNEGEEAEKILSQEISQLESQVNVDVDINNEQQLFDRIEELFSGYDLSIELEKLNIPKDLASKLFNIQLFSIPELKQSVINEFVSGAKEGASALKSELNKDFKSIDWNLITNLTSKTQMGKIREFLQKVTNLENKEQEERLKKYTNYLLKAQSEHVRIKVEEMKQISEIESLKIGNAEKSLMIEGVKKETNKKLQKNTLDEFQRTETYLTLYSDLENTSDKVLEALVVKLRELKTSLSDLPAEDFKKLVSQIERAEEVLIKRNPFKALRDLKKQMEGIESEDVLSNKMISLATKREQVQKILDKEEFKLLNIDPNSEQYENTKLRITALKNVLNLTDEQILGIKELLNLYDQERDGYDAMKDAVNSYKQEIDKLFGSIENLMNALGVESDSMAFIILDSAKSMASLITSAIMFRAQLKAMKVEANATLGVIGWIAMAIEAIAMGISAVFKAHDNKLSKQLELQAKQVERLEKEFENLDNLIDKASSATLLKSYSDEAISNLKRQRVAYQQMYALEDDKKSSDEAKMEDYKDKMAELDKQILEQQHETINKARGNIIDDVLSTANSFTDAWLNAFQETSNGMSGLKNNFREMMLDMVKQQASLTITGSYLEKWKAELGKYINADDLKLTSEEAKKWASSVTSTLPQLNEALENYFNAMSAAGIDVSGGELSSLEKGIQSITAAQAEAISAYLSSIRFFVSEQHTNVDKIATYMTNNEFFNPIVSQLQSVVEHTKAVKDLLESIRSTNGVSSHGIKVFIE